MSPRSLRRGAQLNVPPVPRQVSGAPPRHRPPAQEVVLRRRLSLHLCTTGRPACCLPPCGSGGRRYLSVSRSRSVCGKCRQQRPDGDLPARPGGADSVGHHVPAVPGAAVRVDSVYVLPTPTSDGVDCCVSFVLLPFSNVYIQSCIFIVYLVCRMYHLLRV